MANHILDRNGACRSQAKNAIGNIMEPGAQEVEMKQEEVQARKRRRHNQNNDNECDERKENNIRAFEE